MSDTDNFNNTNESFNNMKLYIPFYTNYEAGCYADYKDNEFNYWNVVKYDYYDNLYCYDEKADDDDDDDNDDNDDNDSYYYSDDDNLNNDFVKEDDDTKNDVVKDDDN